MKKLCIFFSLISVFIFAGCSYLIEDLNQIKDGSPYTVRHIFENTDGNGYDEENVEEEILYGHPGELTKAEFKVFTGFKPAKQDESQEFPEVIQQIISEDEPTVIEIKYNRVVSHIIIDPNDGWWNYVEGQEEAQNPADLEKIDLQGRYGSNVDILEGVRNRINSLGRDCAEFTGWIASTGGEPLEQSAIFDHISTFPASDVTYTATWKLTGVEYTIKHLIQTLKEDNTVDEVNYTLYETKTDAVRNGGMSKAHPIEIEGFTAPEGEIEQIVIDEEGKSVEIKYKRNKYTVTLDPNGGAWNYKTEKGKQTPAFNVSSKNLEMYFGQSLAGVVEESFGKKSHVLDGWSCKGEKVELPLTVSAENITYKANWKLLDNIEYKVEYYEEKADSSEEEGAFDEANYVLKSHETKTGIAEELTAETAVEKTGFTVRPIENKEIAADGSTVVKVYYKRNFVNIVFNANDGCWNINDVRKGETAVNTDKYITGKYGKPVVYPAEISDTTKLGRIGYRLSGWKIEGDDRTYNNDQLEKTFPADTIIYIAQWIDNSTTPYTVKHWFEKLDSVDSSAPENYEQNMTNYPDQTLYGKEGSLTAAEAKSVSGFTAKTFSQSIISQKVNDDNSVQGNTVINIYYTRNTYKVTLDIRGESVGIDSGAWNYLTHKTDSSVALDSTAKEFTVKYGETFVVADKIGNKYGKKGSVLTGWKKSGELTEIPAENAIFVIGLTDLSLVAVWEKRTVDYYIDYYYEEVTQNQYPEEPSKTEKRQGYPEDFTTVTLDNLTVPAGYLKPESLTGTNKEIASDGSTRIRIECKRNSYAITLKPNDGTWNYTDVKANPALAADNADKEVMVRFGAEIPYGSVFDKLGKRSHELEGWKLNGSGSVIQLPETMPAENVSYTAQWKLLNNVSYKVEHYYENDTSTEAENAFDEDNYSLYSTDNKTGTAETLTEAKAKTVTGLTAQAFSQVEITADGNSVVKIYYKRNFVNVVLNLNGGVKHISVYRTNRSNGATTPASEFEPYVYNGKYGTTINYNVDGDLGRLSCYFAGWSETSEVPNPSYTKIDPISVAGLPTTYPAESKTYYAKWQEAGNIPYTVKHYFEKTTSTNEASTSNYVEDESYRDTFKGLLDDKTTDAFIKDVPGFIGGNIVTSGRTTTFKENEILQQTITVDSKGASTTKDVIIYYKRITSSIIFDPNGGTFANSTSNKTISGKYGAAVTNIPTAPTKTGWAFGGWYKDGEEPSSAKATIDESTYGLENVTYKAYWKSTITVTPSYNTTDISLTVSKDSSGKVTATITKPAGFTNWTYKWYVNKIYQDDKETFVSTTLSKGKKTVLIIATANGQTFTKQAEIVIE